MLIIARKQETCFTIQCENVGLGTLWGISPSKSKWFFHSKLCEFSKNVRFLMIHVVWIKKPFKSHKIELGILTHYSLKLVVIRRNASTTQLWLLSHKAELQLERKPNKILWDSSAKLHWQRMPFRTVCLPVMFYILKQLIHSV